MEAAATSTDPDDGFPAGDRNARFRRFCLTTEPRLRRALVAAYWPDLGSDAAADALAWAWEHFERLERMATPAGCLWRVGQSSTRRERRHWRPPALLPGAAAPTEDFEPKLTAAVAGLTTRQRVAVLLVHGHGYSLTEAAEQMDCRIRTLRNHLERALRKLRHDLGVDTDG